MAIDLDLLCSTLAIPVEKIGNNPNVTRKIKTTEDNYKRIAQETAKDVQTGKPNAGQLGGYVEIVFIRGGRLWLFPL